MKEILKVVLIPLMIITPMALGIWLPKPSKTIVLDEEITRCEQVGGRLRMYYSSYRQSYNLECEVSSRTLYEK